MEFYAPEIFPRAGTNLDNDDKACHPMQTPEMDRDQSVSKNFRWGFLTPFYLVLGPVRGLHENRRVRNRKQDTCQIQEKHWFKGVLGQDSKRSAVPKVKARSRGVGL